MSRRSAVGEGRDNLLASLFDRFGECGPGPDLSMRQIAEQLGVHHTLLTYHFGSRPGLLAAVLAEARRRDNIVIAALDAESGFAAMAQALWDYYAHPDRLERTRAFFHVAGLAVYDLDAYTDFLVDLDALAGLLERAARSDGKTAAQARRVSLIADACIRGLLLQLALTGDRATVEDAAQHFFGSFA